MIKHFTKPFDVMYRTEKSLDKKIESIEDLIEFEKYKLFIEEEREEREERLRKLELELEYYREVSDLRHDDKYLEGIFGGEIIMIASWVLGTVVGIGINKLRK